MRSIVTRLIAFAFLAVTALPLAGCNETAGIIAEKISAVAGYTVTQSQIDGIRASYNAAYLAPAANYRELPKCAAGTSFNILTNRCRDNNIVRQLQSADRAIEDGFNRLQAKLDAGDKTGSVSAYEALKASVTTAINIVASYKINQL